MHAGAGQAGEREKEVGMGRKHQLAARDLGSGHLLCVSVPAVKCCGRGHEGGAKAGREK